jgi:hypothetical protein
MAMATEAPIFTPEVEELLREIAKEPDSVLLRMPREKVKASLMETRSPVGVMTAGLSKAERELVRVHREEFAFQLRQAAWVKLAEDGDGPRVVSRQWQRGTRIPVPSAPQVRNEITRSVGTETLFNWSYNSRTDWITDSLCEWPSATVIAALAHRLAPKSEDLIYAGADHLIRKSPLTALEYFGRALECQSDSAVASVIIGNMANCHDQLDQLFTSISEWKLAHHRDPQRVDLVAGWFIASMRAGYDQGILASDRELRFFDQYPEVVKELAELVSARGELGFWVSTDTLRAALGRWSSKLSTGGNALANSLW